MLNLGTGEAGEARNAAAQETEIGAAKAFLERPAAGGPSMDEHGQIRSGANRAIQVAAIRRPASSCGSANSPIRARFTAALRVGEEIFAPSRSVT